MIFACHIHFRGCGLQTQFLSLSLFFYQRPGRPPRGPPLAPPLGGGHSRGSGLASSLLLAASPPALLASRVCVAALVGRQLAGQPERGRYRPGRRRGLHRFGRREGVDLTGITDSSLALLLAGSAVSPPMM